MSRQGVQIRESRTQGCCILVSLDLEKAQRDNCVLVVQINGLFQERDGFALIQGNPRSVLIEV